MSSKIGKSIRYALLTLMLFKCQALYCMSKEGLPNSPEKATELLSPYFPKPDILKTRIGNLQGDSKIKVDIDVESFKLWFKARFFASKKEFAIIREKLKGIDWEWFKQVFFIAAKRAKAEDFLKKSDAVDL
jgi:hypothetical protein